MDEALLMAVPTLRFRLPGAWYRLDLRGGPATEASIKAAVRRAIGVADDRAHLRAEMREELRRAVESAQRAEATSLMFATEITPGTPLPITLTVYAPNDLRMSPAVGTRPDAVLATFAESLGRLERSGASAVPTQVEGPGVPALRLDRHEPIPSDGAVPAELPAPSRVVADYYVPVPGSKQVAMVRFSSPMGILADLLLDLFDTLVAAAYFSAAP